MRIFLDELVVLPYDQHVAVRWGEILAYARLRGRPRPTNDSWIAACCLVRDLALATFNIKDQADFAEHEGLQLLLEVATDVLRFGISRFVGFALGHSSANRRARNRRSRSVAASRRARSNAARASSSRPRRRSSSARGECR